MFSKKTKNCNKFFLKKYCFQKQVSFENKFSKTIFLQKHDVGLKKQKKLINISVNIKFV